MDEHPEEYQKIISTPAFASTNTLVDTYEKVIIEFFHEIVKNNFPIRRQPGIRKYGVTPVKKSRFQSFIDKYF